MTAVGRRSAPKKLTSLREPGYDALVAAGVYTVSYDNRGEKIPGCGVDTEVWKLNGKDRVQALVYLAEGGRLPLQRFAPGTVGHDQWAWPRAKNRKVDPRTLADVAGLTVGEADQLAIAV